METQTKDLEAVEKSRVARQCCVCGAATHLGCGFCGAKRYCSWKCQAVDWKVHRKECSRDFWKQFKQKGNMKFMGSEFSSAAAFYIRALKIIPPQDAVNQAVVMNNLGLCYLRLSRLREAIDLFSHVIQIAIQGPKKCPAYTFMVRPEFAFLAFKAFMRRSQILESVGNSAAALQDVVYALKIDHSSATPRVGAAREEAMKSYVRLFRLEHPAKGFNPPELGNRELNIVGSWIRVNVEGSPPRARTGHIGFGYDGHMYVFGGEIGNMIFETSLLSNDMHRLCVKDKSFKWERVWYRPGVIPSPRVGHSGVVFNGKLYVVGGDTETEEEKSRYKELGDELVQKDTRSLVESQGDVWEFDLVTHEWKPIGCTGDRPVLIHGHSVVLLGDKMYLFGGEIFDSEKALSSSRVADSNYLYSLDLKTFVWTMLSGTRENPRCIGEHQPEARVHCGLWASPSNNRIYLMGGTMTRMDKEYHHTIDDLWYYDVDQQKWVEDCWRGNFPCSRSEFAVGSHRGRMFFSGGFSSRILTALGKEKRNSAYLGDTFCWNDGVFMMMTSSDSLSRVHAAGSSMATVQCGDNEELILFGGYREVKEVDDIFQCFNYTHILRLEDDEIE